MAHYNGNLVLCQCQAGKCVLGRFGPFWAVLGRFGPFMAIFGHFWPFFKDLNASGHVIYHPCMNHYYGNLLLYYNSAEMCTKCAEIRFFPLKLAKKRILTTPPFFFLFRNGFPMKNWIENMCYTSIHLP